MPTHLCINVWLCVWLTLPRGHMHRSIWPRSIWKMPQCLQRRKRAKSVRVAGCDTHTHTFTYTYTRTYTYTYTHTHVHTHTHRHLVLTHVLVAELIYVTEAREREAQHQHSDEGMRTGDRAAKTAEGMAMTHITHTIRTHHRHPTSTSDPIHTHRYNTLC